MNIQCLTIKEVQYTAHVFAKNFMEWNEPIPEFSTRYPHKLESCLRVPFQTFGRRSLYKGLLDKAAILFYLMIKNHPFQNGNKRIAITTLFLFLKKNKKWVTVSNQELYNFAIWIASSPAELKEQSLEAIKAFIRKHWIEIE